MNETITIADIAIVGAGMAGASLAAEIGDAARVVLIEGEAQPGYHSTGRSAAFWQETYGGPAVQPLTSASFAFLEAHGFLGAREAVYLARPTGLAALDRLKAELGSKVHLDPLTPQQLDARIPGLRSGLAGGLAEPSCRDIDVAGLHAHYLSRARQAGAMLLADARVEAITREDGRWRIATRDGEVRATIIVDAAGAWADQVAAMAGVRPIGIAPFRRTMVQLQVDPAALADLPLVMDAEQRFYFKPEAGGRIWLSPHDEAPTPPCDAAPEEIDIAVAIDRLERVVDWRIVRRERAWAGLRSFAPDRAPVYGFDVRAPGFFWCAGQGGFGIQTAPAAASIAAALLLGRSAPAETIDIDRYAPRRFG
ncbi:NAD(P)/FAD-dependent oxidoreductase [Rhizorhabdus dicambivorans]|uniref:FAD-binding oxidoreductase n=1 Tax=Rhizorhabdus dicambivorans TaxID=1850238 RepID=A0A2A4G2Z2_9SPHN|nr:FAD-dependent oxidoreductase [Rhizorhabdus dicambivorans]ATE64859.1 FAD-binding oxidoreductase [Rhizorhabdus dicambivorans]PCE44133.1 FAD-binding oxidoreductase [Rhizorhabdus dicambivorans]